MADIYKSIFQDEILVHIEVRRQELGREAFRHYQHVVQSFDEYIYELGLDEKHIHFHMVDGWIKKISSGITLNTVGQYIHYIRQFLSYLSACGYKCAIPQNLRARDTYVPYLYSDSEIQCIFEAVDNMVATKEPPKNKWIYREMPMLLRLLYCCGMRVGEAVNITVGDVDFSRLTIVLRVTKKCKQRLVPINNELAEQLRHYCISMGILEDSSACLFPGTDRYSPLATNSARNYFQTVLGKAGITREGYGERERGPCLHCFRHSFAVKSFSINEKDGMKSRDAVPFLSTYLGHDSLYGTEKYLKYSGDYFSSPVMLFEAFSGELFPEVNFDA